MRVPRDRKRKGVGEQKGAEEKMKKGDENTKEIFEILRSREKERRGEVTTKM